MSAVKKAWRRLSVETMRAVADMAQFSHRSNVRELTAYAELPSCKIELGRTTVKRSVNKFYVKVTVLSNDGTQRTLTHVHTSGDDTTEFGTMLEEAEAHGIAQGAGILRSVLKAMTREVTSELGVEEAHKVVNEAVVEEVMES